MASGYAMYLSQQGLEHIASHKYKSAGYSWFDNVLNPFWEYCVGFLPMWLAPNLVTLIGTISMVMSYALGAWLQPGLDTSTPLPAWALMCMAVAQWFYNTMDSIDGKQARRTGSSSPLGQLFDHGCDALVTVVMSFNVASALELGPGWATIILLYTMQGAFFLAQWEEKHIHVFRTNVGGLGVTEAQYIVISLFFGTSVMTWLGFEHFWSETQIFGVPLNLALLSLLIATPIITCLDFLRKVATEADDVVGAFSELVPIACTMSFAAYFNANQCDEIEGDVFRVLFSTVGLMNVHMITVMIINAMAHQHYTWLQPTAFQLPVALANIQFGLVSFDAAMWILLEGTAALYLHYVVSVVDEITNHLSIRCFVIGHKSEPAARRGRSPPASKPRRRRSASLTKRE